LILPRKSLQSARLAGVSLIALSAIIPAAAPAVAQTSGQTVDTITVTTTRREEDISDVPSLVSAASGEDIAPFAEGGGDILQLANRTPSLYAESSNGRVAPRFYIRGLGNTDFDLAASQPVSVIMDGVVQENVILKSFPLFDIAQMEVSRGPQGTLFGRNTTAGIIKFDSVRPGQETDGYAAVTFGTLGTVNAEAAIGGALIEDKLSARLSFFTQNREDWIDNAFTGQGDALGGFNETAGRLQFLYEPTDTFSALLNVHARSYSGTSAVFRANILSAGSNGLNRNFDRDRVFYDGGANNPQAYDSWGASATLSWDVGGGELVSITGYESTEGFSRGDIDGGNMVNGPGFIPFPSDTQDSIDFLDQYSQELRYASDASGPFSWQAGAYWFDSKFQITTFGPDGGFPPPASVRHGNELWSIFGQASYDMSDDLTLSGGVRFTQDEKDLVAIGRAVSPVEAEDEQVSWDLSAIYDVNDQTNVFARVARGFRGPSIQGRDIAFFNQPSVADSETSLSWEAGFHHETAGGRARINGAAFTYTVDDLQLTAVGGAGNLVQLINADEGVGYGFEIDAEAWITDNLYVTLGYSLNKTELQDEDLEVGVCGFGRCTLLDPDVDNDGFVEVDGNPFPQAPESILSFTARYGIPVADGGEWFIYTDWFWQGETNLFLYESEEFNSDGNFEGGLRAGYAGETSTGRDWEAALFVRNITDEENLVGGIDFNNLTGFVNEPRVWGASFRTSLR
jgi:outer membrane receptor protein involved in Fe transport